MKRLIEGKDFCTSMNKVVKVMGTENWCLVGGRAVEFYTNPPQSPDSDILCNASVFDIRSLIKKFKALNMHLREEYEEGYIAFLEDRDNGGKVDIMPTYDQFEIAAIGMAKSSKCGKAIIPVVEVEDLVILKAAAACSPGTGLFGRSPEKKLRDTKAIWILNDENDLDGKYIKKALEKENMDREIKLLTKLKVIS